MRKICVFCERWESGGIESFLNNILLNIDRAGLEVDIVASSMAASVFTAGLKEVGVRFVELSGKQRSPRNYNLFRKLLRERGYDAVHFNLFQGLSLSYVQIAKQEGIPVRIVHSHNTALRKSKTRWLKMGIHRAAKSLFSAAATERWACSKAAAEFMFPAGVLAKAGFRFVPNGIDTARFRFDPEQRAAVRARLGLEDAFVVGNVGRLCYQKNQDFLLDVFAQVAQRRRESWLLLVGEGEEKETLEHKAARLGIAEQVIFYGTTTCVEELYWAMDAFAFPSLFEGLGIAAVEAQTAGLPVVCSEYVPREAEASERVRFLPLDVDAWASAMLEADTPAAADAAQRVRQAGYDIADVARMIQNVYGGGNGDAPTDQCHHTCI